MRATIFFTIVAGLIWLNILLARPCYLGATIGPIVHSAAYCDSWRFTLY